MERLIASLRILASSHPELAKLIRTEADYFQSNAERMRYPQFRRQKLFIGSGVIEAAKPSLGRDSNSPACFGPCVEPTPSSPSAAADSMESLRTTGSPVEVDPLICRAPPR